MRHAMVVAVAVLFTFGCAHSSRPLASRSARAWNWHVSGAGCPPTYPRASLSSWNAGVPGLHDRLAPIVARRIRVCRYGTDGQFDAAGIVTDYATAPEEADANVDTGVKVQSDLECRPYRPGLPMNYLVTFASDSQQVTIEAPQCGGMTNGVRTVSPSANLRFWYELGGDSPAPALTSAVHS
jgi:hypothetical protein